MFGQLVRLAPEAIPQSILPSYVVPPPLPAPGPAQSPHPSQEQEDLKQQREALEGIRNVMESLCRVLAPRALLFFAMFGALGLTVPALLFSDWHHLLAGLSFDVLVFWPTAFLYWKG